jgi:hypothetical protein
VPYKYVKKYRLDAKHHRPQQLFNDEEDDDKSIESIEDKLEDFEERLERSRVRRSRAEREEDRQCSAMRWFSGMSSHYLHKHQPEGLALSNFQRLPSFDIEGELRQSRQRGYSVPRSMTEPVDSVGRG